MIVNKYSTNLILILFISLVLGSYACNNFDSNKKICLQCPLGTHLYKGNCIYNIDYCAQYQRGIDCNKCQNGYKLVVENERIECRKLQIKQNNLCFEQEIYIHHKEPTSSLGEDRIEFYDFLDDYLNKKYIGEYNEKRLLKILDRQYKNGDHEVIVFYKVSKNVYKAIVNVINNYKSLQMKYFGNIDQNDIPQNQIIPLTSNDNKQNYHFQGAKIQLNQTQVNKPLTKVSQISVNSSKIFQESMQKRDQDQISQLSDINYEYQKPQHRQKDIGFQTSNQYLKLSNTKLLGQNAKVIGCFIKTTGLRKNYRIMYKAINSQIYEGEVIYDVIKRRAYILNFGKRFNA